MDDQGRYLAAVQFVSWDEICVVVLVISGRPFGVCGWRDPRRLAAVNTRRIPARTRLEG